MWDWLPVTNPKARGHDWIRCLYSYVRIVRRRKKEGGATIKTAQPYEDRFDSRIT